MGRFPTKARGRKVPGVMNKLETQYAEYLEGLKQEGVILWYEYEAIKLRLAKNTTWTPDFFVMKSDGTLEVHECKGVWHSDARVKIKVAAEHFPFQFYAIQRIKKQWVVEEF